MRAVLFSDLHLHTYTDFSQMDKDGINRRLREGEKVLYEILNYCLANSIKTIVSLGDLFHNVRSIHPTVIYVFNLFIKTLENSDIKFYTIYGNHDTNSLNIGIGRSKFEILDLFSSHNFMVFNDISMARGIRLGNIYFHTIDVIQGKQKMIEALQNIKIKEGFTNVFLGHFLCDKILEQDGVKYIHNAIPYDVLSSHNLDFILLGDYHKKVNIPDLNLRSLGSVMHNNFSDASRPQGTFLDIDFETGEEKYIPVSAPMFKIIPSNIKWPTAETDNTHYYRVHVKDSKQKLSVEDKLKRLGGDWKVKWIFDSKINKQSQIDAYTSTISVNPQDMVKEYCNKKQQPLFLEKGIQYVTNV